MHPLLTRGGGDAKNGLRTIGMAIRRSKQAAAEIPEWLQRAIEETQALSQLPFNWNGYGDAPPSAKATQRAERLLRSFGPLGGGSSHRGIRYG